MKLIAELCQNHNGNFDMVKRMVEAAAEAGATHVKIQTIYAANLSFRTQFETGLERDGRVLCIKRPWQPEYDRLKGLELTPDQCAEFAAFCNDTGVIPLTTCFARGNLREISSQGFREIKVASYDCASYQLLRELSGLFEHIYVSTGATFDNEIKYAASILQAAKAKYSLLHCVTVYPTPLEDMNLARLAWLRNYSSHAGFSDHSLVARDGVLASKAAIALGAEVVERHFTILGANESRDGPVSITPAHMRELAEFSKLPPDEQIAMLSREYPEWEKMIGKSERELTDAELLNRDYYRGRFATPRSAGVHSSSKMIYNWEETPV